LFGGDRGFRFELKQIENQPITTEAQYVAAKEQLMTALEKEVTQEAPVYFSESRQITTDSQGRPDYIAHTGQLDRYNAF
jgi:hypothetical protein